MANENGTNEIENDEAEENAFAILTDEIKARGDIVAGAPFANKINGQVGRTVQSELADYTYGYMARLAEHSAEAADMLLEHDEALDELEASVERLQLLVQSTEAGKILLIAARLSELVLAKVEDADMKQLANVVLTATKALFPIEETPAAIAEAPPQQTA